MVPAFEVKQIFRGDPMARTRSEKAVGSGFGGEDFGGGGDELPEEPQDREAEGVVKSTFVLKANIKLAVRSASANELGVGVLPSGIGGLRTKDEAEVLRGVGEDDLVPVNEWSLESFSAEFLEVTLPKRNKDSFGEIEREA
jgi:hypothetical protein